jgi:hypothetical protein
MVYLLLCAVSAWWTFRVCCLYSYLVHNLCYICFFVQRVHDGHLDFVVFIIILSMIYGISGFCAASAQWTFRVCCLYSYFVHDLWYICFSVQRVHDGHLEFVVFIVIWSMIYGISAASAWWTFRVCCLYSYLVHDLWYICSECTMDI